MKSNEKILQKKVKEAIRQEYDSEITSLRNRDDFSGEFEYFLQILSLSAYPEKFRQRFKKPLIGLACVQAPLELFDAFGFHPFRMCRHSSASHRISASHLPSLACPVIKSCLSSFYSDESIEKLCDLIVIPTTCDWTAKLPEMIKDKAACLHIMELPRLKESERSRKRWLEEIYELKRKLESKDGHGLSLRNLRLSIAKYTSAWQLMGQLIEARRKKTIPGTWCIILANAFMLDDVESWMDKIQIVLKNYRKPQVEDNPNVFIAGSPIFFPHLKVSQLIEKAGMFIAADELCTSERSFVGVPVYDDFSEYGILKALAEKYQLICSCPTFTYNDRRIKNILETMRNNNIKGLVYHLLKGCHPYDIESYNFEKIIKDNGFHFIKIETDYSKEDEKNILVRLEAFRETLL